MQLRDKEYRSFQMRTCGVCCERRWWRNDPGKKSVPQRYIKPLDETNMYPSLMRQQELQEVFDELNLRNGQPTYTLCKRALEAAHRVELTDGASYVCSLCCDTKTHKKTKYARWEIFNRFNMMIPSPAPRTLNT